MLTIFPNQADDALDVAALPPTENTELNYRTRPLSDGQEVRLTTILLFGLPPFVIISAVIVQWLCWMLPIAGHVLFAIAVTFFCGIGVRKLTGAFQRRDQYHVIVVILIILGYAVWEFALGVGGSSLAIPGFIVWLTAGAMAHQVAAWILAAPTVDFETTMRWKYNLPHLVSRGFSLDCPELLTNSFSPALIAVSLFGASTLQGWLELPFSAWLACFAATTLAVWLGWHSLLFLILPPVSLARSLMVTWHAMIVFCTYDVHYTPAAGVFRFPSRWLRSPMNRWLLVLGTVVTVGCCIGSNCPHPLVVMHSGGSYVLQVCGNMLVMFLAGPLILFATLWLSAGTVLARFEKEFAHHRNEETTDWDIYVDRMINSNDPLEREHLLIGTAEQGDYPVLVHSEIFDQHTHILGDSGASKTALAIGPQATQLIARADSSVVIIDLKGDKALFESCRREAARTGKMRFRWITNEIGRSTFGFNPLHQSHNSKLTVEQLSQELLQGLSLDYGIQYGAGYFTAMNEIVMNTVMHETGARSFTELNKFLGDRNFYKGIGHEEDWKQARHLSALVQRLASCQAINLVPGMYPDEPLLHQNAVDCSDVLDKPQVIYLWLRSSTEPTNAPAIARLFLWAMFCAAGQRPPDQNRVYFFIDELQQIVSDGIKLIFEHFRDMGGTIIGAHQTAGQLMRSGSDFGETVDSCTAMKQVFRASDLKSLERLQKLSGTKREIKATWHQPHERGGGDVLSRYETFLAEDGLVRVTEGERARFDLNDLQAISSRRQSSLVRFTFGSGFTQFGGKTIAVKSQFHISFDQYNKRRKMPWPSDPGAFVSEAPSKCGEPKIEVAEPALGKAKEDFTAEFEKRGRA